MCDFYLTALASSKEDCTLNVSVYMHTQTITNIEVFEKHPILYRGFITLRVDGGCFYLQQNFLLFFAFPIFYSLIHISELCLTSHHYLCIISHIYLYHLFLFCYPALHQHYYPRVRCHFVTEMRIMTLWKLNDYFGNLNLEWNTIQWHWISCD